MAGRAPLPDPVALGVARGWRVIDGAAIERDQALEADVVIVGSGAGGGVTAEILALSGLRVIIVEEGALKSSTDFKMREADAYPALYQESAARKTRDRAINILQGRTVGGSTTISWTSSTRTPASTLAFWRERYGLASFNETALAPWFAMMEERLGIDTWQTPPNENNDVLRRGAAALGIGTATVRRSVRGCWNLGYCGMGCPTNAKQSMLVTTIPSALEHGATLLTRVRAERLVIDKNRVDSLLCTALGPDGLAPNGKNVVLRARHFVIAGGAINSPALLLRSHAPDPNYSLGRRTFLHPTVLSAGLFAQRVDAYAGAPQSVYSDHFLKLAPVDGAVGFMLEAPPMHPVMVATMLGGFGTAHAETMREFPHLQGLLAPLRDGFHPGSTGGSVTVKDGAPVLHYPIHNSLWDGARRALLAMAEIQFAAGARSVQPGHEMAGPYTSWAAAKVGIAELDCKVHVTRLISSHVMGGCAMDADPERGVVDPDGRYYGLDNLSVHDASLFPTSIGANPQLTIYAVVARMASTLAQALTGQPAARPVAGPDQA